MRFLVNIILALVIVFSGLNSFGFSKKKSIDKTPTEQTVVKKEKKQKVKKIKQEKAEKPVKEKKIKSQKIKEEKTVKSAKEKPVSSKKKKNTNKFYNDDELKNMTQTEREQALVEEQYRYKQRSALAMKLNPNLDVIEIRASHILVKNRKDALNIRKDILNGKISFEDAAMQYSLCPTGMRGGDLGYFTRKKMDQNFADRAFDLKIGEISDPVGTKFGWHIIKVVDKR